MRNIIYSWKEERGERERSGEREREEREERGKERETERRKREERGRGGV